ncbi:ABC transporter ATP-binding protein [Humidisolicoccus flavus]|uniref:ABC transporter ATP-binding protein n=1 Tax=Humidisolicoccus flavus TaxID=3111414 RepID=UPI00324E0C71
MTPTASAEPAALRAMHLSKHYGTHVALDDLDVTVPRGEIVAFVGANGAGKSTALRVILGLEHGGGRVLFSGHRYRDLENPLQEVGVAFDELHAHPGHSALQHLRIHAARGAFSPKLIAPLLDELGLLRSLHTTIRKFSLGMRQRLSLATGLLGAPRLLVLDEPFNGLDPLARDWLRSHLRTHADSGGAVLLSVHALDEVRDIVDTVLVLSHGTNKFTGTLDAFASTYAKEALSVASPDRARLVDALDRAGASDIDLRNETLVVTGLSALQVAEAALERRVLVTTLHATQTSLGNALVSALHDDIALANTHAGAELTRSSERTPKGHNATSTAR